MLPVSFDKGACNPLVSASRAVGHSLIMNIAVEKQPKCVAILRAEIPANDVSARREKIVARYASKARIPGFRPGKAPKAVVAKRFEKEVGEELAEALHSDACKEAMRQESLHVLEFGAPEGLEFDAAGNCSFATKLMLAPDLALPDYKNIEVTVPTPADPDAAVDAQLDDMRQRQAEFNDIEGRGAEIGDILVCDYRTMLDGVPTGEALGRDVGFLGGREEHWIKLEEDAFLPGFSAAVIGMSPGETREFPLTLAEDFPIQELAGRDLAFTVKAQGIKQAVLPELDDEFAARLVPGKSLDELKALLRENHEAQESRRIDDLKVDRIIAALLAQTNFELPEEMVARETQAQADSMVDRGISQGLSNEEIAQHQEEIFARANARAVDSLKANFLLREIAKAEDIKVNDAELINHLGQVAASRNIAPKKFIKDLVREDRIEGIRQSMLSGKAIDFLLEHAKITEEEASETDAPAEATPE